MKKRWILLGLIVLFFIVAAIPHEEKKPVKVYIDLCARDPKDQEFWMKSGIYLFDRPGGLAAGAKPVGKIPACGVTVEILDQKVVNGVVFCKVRFQDIEGWQTRCLILGD